MYNNDVNKAWRVKAKIKVKTSAGKTETQAKTSANKAKTTSSNLKNRPRTRIQKVGPKSRPRPRPGSRPRRNIAVQLLMACIPYTACATGI